MGEWASIVLQKKKILIDFYWLLMQNSSEWDINYVNYDFTSVRMIYMRARLIMLDKLIQEHSLMVNGGQKQNADCNSRPETWNLMPIDVFKETNKKSLSQSPTNLIFFAVEQ